MVAICAGPGGTDLGATLVAEGLARAYVRYSEDYVAAEDAARRDHRGLWQGAALAPWDYRNAGFVAAAPLRRAPVTGAPASAARRVRRPAFARAAARTDPAGAKARALADVALKAPASAPPSPGCRIKGNVSAAGERVYHLPGGRVLRPDPHRPAPRRGLVLRRGCGARRRLPPGPDPLTARSGRPPADAEQAERGNARRRSGRSRPAAAPARCS